MGDSVSITSALIACARCVNARSSSARVVAEGRRETGS